MISLSPANGPVTATPPAAPCLGARRTPSRCILLGLALPLLILAGVAAVPTLEQLHPSTFTRGTTQEVTVGGKFEPWPARFFADAEGVRITATTNKGRALVAIETNAPLGASLIRAVNAEGSSAPKPVVIEDRPVELESEPNDELSAAQSFRSWPVLLSGRLDKAGDVDSFQVQLRAGQTLVARAESYELGSSVDLLLRVLDTNATQLAFNHDDGRTLDPFLAFTAPADATYIVQVLGFPYPAISDVRLGGGEGAVYRLHLHHGPYVTNPLPLGVPTHPGAPIAALGFNLGPGAVQLNPRPSPRASPDDSVRWFEFPGAAENLALCPAQFVAESVETEPNDLPTAPGTLKAGSAVTGRLSAASDVDRFQMEASQGKSVEIALEANALRFLWNPWIAITAPDGKELARKDDAVDSDPSPLLFTPPSNGVYQVVVRDLLGRGGSNAWYRLSAAHPVPGTRAVAAAHDLVLAPGTTNELKVTVSFLGGFKPTPPARITPGSLPPGVTASGVDVPENGGEVGVKFVATTNAAPFEGVLRLLLTAQTNEPPVPVQFQLNSTAVNNGVPNGYTRLVVNRTTNLWLTVAAPKAKP